MAAASRRWLGFECLRGMRLAAAEGKVPAVGLLLARGWPVPAAPSVAVMLACYQGKA